MAVEVYELDPGPITAGAQSTGVKRYIVLGAGDNENVAYAAVASAAPAEYLHPTGEALPIESVELDTYSGNGAWFATCSYSSKASEEAPSEAGTGTTPSELPQPPASTAALNGSISFDTSGGTLHITQSKTTVESVKAGGGNPPDNKKAIGVHGDSDQIDGVDVVVPKLEITIKRKLGIITPAYLQVLRDLTGTVNNAKFFRFNAGEVLFLGASGDLGNEGWDVSFKFAISPNEADVDVGNGMTITTKKGWEYIWCGYSPASSNNALTRQPIYAYLEKVYSETDFRQLGLFANG